MSDAMLTGSVSRDELHKSFYPLTWLRAVKTTQSIQDIGTGFGWVRVVWLLAPFTTIEGIGWKQISSTDFECVLPGVYLIDVQGNWANSTVGNRLLAPVINGTHLARKGNWESEARTVSPAGSDEKSHVKPILFDKGDTLGINVAQDTGAPLNLLTSGTELNIFSVAYDPGRF